ncbi:MurR/RpiR family transcriptional regulator [Rhizobium mongolense]|uniref:MurR/RpiR family transcriptional regulator n=1 Tax=Rhizobium mongolense TaxID=57676 RepID=UPI0034A39309
MSGASPLVLSADVSEKILDRLQEEIDQLPNALARIAKYVLENPEKVLHQSVAELGEFSGSGEASILRLCRRIGFTGFRDFKIALAVEVGRPRLAAPVGAEPDAASQILHDVMTENLAVARSRTDPETIANIATVLMNSRRIDLYGTGMSGLSAELFAYRLLRAGLTAVAFRNAYMAHELASGLGPGCVAIGFSISGLTDETLQFIKSARAAGATTVAITNRTRSPIGDAAHFTLHGAGLHDRPIGGTLTSMVGKIYVIESIMLDLGRLMDASRPR